MGICLILLLVLLSLSLSLGDELQAWTDAIGAAADAARTALRGPRLKAQDGKLLVSVTMPDGSHCFLAVGADESLVRCERTCVSRETI
jgi:hypothetical protein